jgi:hypothetical protein
MMETIPDQLESCRYDVCVQKQLKFGKIKGVIIEKTVDIYIKIFQLFQRKKVMKIVN